MADILNNTTKFKILGSVQDLDKIILKEQWIQHELLGFYNEHLIHKTIHPVGSQRLQLYGPPKI